jgi:secreted PhoX family phosphatase
MHHPLVTTGSCRRRFLQQSFAGMGWIMAGTMLSRCGGNNDGKGTTSNIASLGPLGEPDDNGLRLPAGFSSRVVARSGMPVGSSDYVWHNAPDGGAVFPVDDAPDSASVFGSGDAGWIYVSNSETVSTIGGGASAIRFGSNGAIVDAYRILEGTNLNCAGGITPWGSWLSCEELSRGRVWECDPLGRSSAVVREAMGVFEHEAVAIDQANQHAYMTEDVGDGRFYRFAYDASGDLSSGELQVAEVMSDGPEGSVQWHTVPDPSAQSTETRFQVPSSTPFDGGEGIWFHEGVVYFSTKGDDRIWAYETSASMLSIVYDAATSSIPILTGVDNVTGTPAGDVLVAEDGGDMQMVAITADGTVLPVVQIVGQENSEITGPAFDPSLQRLYFSSQRGIEGTDPLGMSGITFEVTGPFFV